MSKKNVLRCFAKKDGDVFVAICVDLNLAAQGSSMDEAKQRLHEQMHTYIHEALTVDQEYTDDLLSRKAPASVLFEYHRIRLLVSIVSRVAKLVSSLKSKNFSIFSETAELKHC